ncbi:MAG: PD-(D/E)XK nuclease family protein [Anaerolineales bacterium]|nr:PD-(D/E)XK nuclease family protein [Anaerolineales bacterium]
MELKRFDFTPILGWSMTRYDLFSICKRKYYYQYYAKYDPEFPRARIEALKELTTIPLEIGAITHDIIKVLLQRLARSQAAVDRDRLFEYARDIAQGRCKAKRFSEVYYIEREEISLDDVFPKVKSSLENLLGSERFQWLCDPALQRYDRWLIEPPGFGETRISGMKAYCKVDFLLPVQHELFVLDWKTGKRDEDKHGAQLIGYAAWASFHFETDPQAIRPIIAYLFPDYVEMELRLEPKDVGEFEQRVRVETQEMFAYCQDVEKNIPKEKSVFPKASNRRICEYCNFRELCKIEPVST